MLPRICRYGIVAINCWSVDVFGLSAVDSLQYSKGINHIRFPAKHLVYAKYSLISLITEGFLHNGT